MKTSPLPLIPPPDSLVSADTVATGKNVPAIERLRIMSPKEWADFILEWTTSIKGKYERVERCDGAGDLGRDIVAFEKNVGLGAWDNYQCKHYDHPLIPSDIWIELGKLVYYTWTRDYSVPRAYYFVAPQGVGNTLSKLLRESGELEKGLIKNWDKHCRRAIASTKEIVLSGNLLAHVSGFNFSIVQSVSPLIIIEQHRVTPWHAVRFGGGLPLRPKPPDPPASVADSEANYVRALLDAYQERLKVEIPGQDCLKDKDLFAHFSRSRKEFYSAEALKEFSRDNVPIGTFEQLLDEVFHGVADVVEAKHTDAVERVLATVSQAKSLQLSASALVTRILTADRGGMCHQLANDLRVKWKHS